MHESQISAFICVVGFCVLHLIRFSAWVLLPGLLKDLSVPIVREKRCLYLGGSRGMIRAAC